MLHLKTLACLALAAGLAACTLLPLGAPQVSAAASAASAPAVVEPNPNLVVQGVPPVPLSLAKEVAKYNDFRGHGFVDWHPTRREMLVAHRKAGGNTVQLFRVASPLAEPEQLTDFADPVTSARYEPRDGKYIVFERSVGGSEADQIYRLDLETRQVALLTDPSERHGIEAWLHRSGRLLISSVPLDRTADGGTRAKVTQTLTLIDPANPTSRRRLAELEGTGWGVGSVSWNDRLVALTRYISANESQVWLLNLATGKRTQVLPGPRSKARGVHFAGPFKRDNSGLYVVSDRHGEFRELMFYRFATRRLTPITRHIPWDVTGTDATEDDTLVALRANVDGRDELRLFSGRNHKEQALPPLPSGSVSAIDFHRRRGELAFSVISAKAPWEIHTLDPKSGRVEQWTRAYAPPDVDMAGFSEQVIVRWPSFDRRTISGLLTLPPARFTGRRPVLIRVHGGPEGQAKMGFLWRYNHFLNDLGIAVIEPNVRGSSGYGKTFLTLDNGTKREDSVRDIGAMLDWIATQPQLDASRVLVAGGSYGGYMSLAVSTHYAERIAGAIDVVGISNFVTFLQNTESYRRDLRRVEYGDERDPAMRAFLKKISPLTNASRIVKPLFVVQGKNDPRVPYTEAEQIVAKARGNGTPVWYLRAENEGHGFVRKENADYYFYATVMFVRETLLK
ncbi:S9 family peptidase [Piscinibacter sp.]|uniref:S9 family peptidase n=1 Tax=Piscinibacter sp. TaxID=1903157 RepID=UPI002C6CF5D3|nr:prolyl oligopeptidase family serine peptidase [Albitalea sp.]HUG22462.1 prolyl oligopeptidase family serine peptidase [Albitalea sp.]